MDLWFIDWLIIWWTLTLSSTVGYWVLPMFQTLCHQTQQIQRWLSGWLQLYNFKESSIELRKNLSASLEGDAEVTQWVRALGSSTHVKQPSTDPINSGTAEERQENLLCLLVTSLAQGSERPYLRGRRREVTDRINKHMVHTSIYTTLNIHTRTQTHRRWCWGMAGRAWLMKLITANIQDLKDSFMGGMGKTWIKMWKNWWALSRGEKVGSGDARR